MTKMHKMAPHCTYIEDKADMSARELHEMYEEAFFKGYEAGQRDSLNASTSEISVRPRNVRDFFYSLGKSNKNNK